METDAPLKSDSRPLSSASSAESLNSLKPKSPSSIVASCPTCGKSFCSVGALKRHNISIHLKNEIFPCNVAGCGKTFLLKEYLKKHLRRFHKLPPMFPRKRKSTSDLKALKTSAKGMAGGVSAPEKGLDISGESPDQTSSGQSSAPPQLKTFAESLSRSERSAPDSASPFPARPSKPLARKKSSSSTKTVRISADESVGGESDGPLSDAASSSSSPEKPGAGLGIAGKGKRRKQKKALVEGWVDPDELGDDYWLPGAAKKVKIAEKKKGGETVTPEAVAAAAAAATAALNAMTAASVASAAPAAPALKKKTIEEKPVVDGVKVETNLITPARKSSGKSPITVAGKSIPMSVGKPALTPSGKSVAPPSAKSAPTPAGKSSPTPGKKSSDASLQKLKKIRSKTLADRKELSRESRFSPAIDRKSATDSPTPSSSGAGQSSKSVKGPVIRVRGDSVDIVNNPEAASQVINGCKPAKCRYYAGPYVNEKIAKGFYNRPPTHFVLNYEDTHNWRCMLCGHGNFFDDLGQLFGPFHVAESKLDAIFAESLVSLCRESMASMSEAAVLSPRRSRIVAGTKGPVQGSKSPTRSAITSSGNIAQETDDSVAVTNPDPEPFEIWLHESCVVWSVGVYMVEGKLYGLEEALNLAAETKCSFCLELGASLGCFKSCNSNYHFHCARKNCCQFNEETFTIRCPKHAESRSTVLTASKENVAVVAH